MQRFAVLLILLVVGCAQPRTVEKRLDDLEWKVQLLDAIWQADVKAEVRRDMVIEKRFRQLEERRHGLLR